MNENLNPNHASAAEFDELDELDALLMMEPAYIDDAGFTSRVVQSLPARRQAWLLRRLILGVASFVAVCFGWMALPQGQDISTWTRIAMHSAFSSPILTISAIAALGVTLLSASVVWVVQDR